MKEARAIAAAKVQELRELPWAELRDRYLGRSETVEVRGASDVTYQLEILAVWDAGENGDLRVLVAVDDSGWRAFSPLTEDFIVAPDGSFVGE